MKEPKFDLEHFKKYVSTYAPSHPLIGEFDNKTILNDMLYGLGICLNHEEYSYHSGFSKFKKYLINLFN